MYNIGGFAAMIRDQVRAVAYKRALDSVITRDSILLDLGAGTGVFALYAASRGVRKVYAVEENPILRIGEIEARRLGLSDQIEFFIGSSYDFSPAERANVLTFDLRGSLPFMPGARAAIRDARDRLLADGGTMVPQFDELFAAPYSNPEWYRKAVEQPWRENIFGLDLRSTRDLQASAVFTAPEILPHQCLKGQKWAVLDYFDNRDWTAEEPLEWVIDESREIHGILTWFECQLSSEVRMSAAPGQDRPTVYGRLMLPLHSPIRVASGDRLRIDISATELTDSILFRWATGVYDPSGRCRLKLLQHSMGPTFLAASSKSQ